MYKYKHSLVDHLTCEPRAPESKAHTLAVQHVAAAAEKEQEKKRRTPAPTPGRPCPHLLPDPCWCRSLHTLRGPIRAAQSRFHHAGERGPTVPVSACALLLLQLSLSLSLFLSLPCARMIEKSEQRGEEMRQEERGFSAGYLRAFPGTRRSELREFSTTLAADKLPSSDLAAPVSKTQQAAGERGARGVGVGGSGSPTTETFPHSVLLSRCNSTVISLCCGGVRVFLRPAIPHSHLD